MIHPRPQLMQFDMFGPPEPVESYGDRAGRNDDAPVPSERENLWPSDLVAALGPELIERLYGDLPRRTRLTVPEVCRRLRLDSNHVYRMIEAGSLDAVDLSQPGVGRPYYRVYRYSVVSFLFGREFVRGQTRADLAGADLQRIERAAASRRSRKEGSQVR